MLTPLRTLYVSAGCSKKLFSEQVFNQGTAYSYTWRKGNMIKGGRSGAGTNQVRIRHGTRELPDYWIIVYYITNSVPMTLKNDGETVGAPSLQPSRWKSQNLAVARVGFSLLPLDAPISQAYLNFYASS